MDHSVFGLAMKINRHGRAKILTQQEIQLVFAQGFDSERDKTLFGVCLFTAARIREACTLLTEDIYTPKGQIRPRLIIRKANTKGKLATRSIPVIEDLRQLLSNYYPIRGDVYLFPGRSNGHLAEDSAARILREACNLLAFGCLHSSGHILRRGVATYSIRPLDVCYVAEYPITLVGFGLEQQPRNCIGTG